MTRGWVGWLAGWWVGGWVADLEGHAVKDLPVLGVSEGYVVELDGFGRRDVQCQRARPVCDRRLQLLPKQQGRRRGVGEAVRACNAMTKIPRKNKSVQFCIGVSDATRGTGTARQLTGGGGGSIVTY